MNCNWFRSVTIILFFLTLTIMGQDKEESRNVFIDAPETGSIYLDGKYTGNKTPSTLILSAGEHNVGVGLDKKRIYLRKIITVGESDQKVIFTDDDKGESKTWKALFVGVPTVYAKSRSGEECEATFTKEELDEGFEFFKLNMKEHVEPFSYNAINWEIERRDLMKPVKLTKTDNDWYILEPAQGLEELDMVQPGNYDNVFFFWREEEGDCSFKSGYFGLAWLEPTSDDARETGYVIVKFKPGVLGVAGKIQEYLNNDPGVWTHEWLHVVMEKFYPDLGVNVPLPAKDKLILHMAVEYGYTFPWMDWYKDLISGQVPFGQTFVGIGPEAFLDNTIRETALEKLKQKNDK